MHLKVNGKIANKQMGERTTRVLRMIMQKFVAVEHVQRQTCTFIARPSDDNLVTEAEHIHRLFEGDIGLHHITAVRPSWLGYLPG